ncbi:tetratricopeptide repeat protein [Gillisia sp. M10.2A]|uniref:Tetratricopeptide repeat protein n=1 Tax=Gillisia lutea TaxID=2909668 RepID=A0ABS9EGX8_9FLAO|nr:tetratricopeptide repeat protein [Gillisia lutea]MCF4100711.1 tetratricopeptide repeat protein [Gillisia lutea]
MKKIFYFIMLCSFPVLAQNNDLFNKGNEAYNVGNYEEAVTSYEKILNSGQTSAALYFNLANSHYKLNHIAPSIFYYEKALQLQPNDKEIRNNLEFANNMTIDAIEQLPKTGLSKLLQNLISGFSYNAWAWIAIVAAITFAVLFLLYYFSVSSKFKRLFFVSSMVFLLGCAGTLIFAYLQYNYIQNSEFAIIFTEEVVVKNEPNARANEVFTLHEGTKVEILNTYQNWIEIELANRSKGWMLVQDAKTLK